VCIAGPISICYYPDDRVIPPLREGDKQMPEQETTGIGWFIAGLGLGALLGILFAPKAGKELREGLMTSAKDKKDYVTARSREAREQINSVVDRGREQVNEFAERGKEAAEKGRERWSGIVDRVSGSRSEAEPQVHDDEEPFHGGAAENRF
jgi:gas vesicle protein